MSVYQGRPWETNAYLELIGIPAASVAYTQVTCKYRKFGESSLTTRVLTSSDWVNLGSGFYVLKWPASILNVLGTFFFTLTGSSFDNFVYDEFDVDPAPISLSTPADVCLVSGNLSDLSANPVHNAVISARLVSYPASGGSSVITSDSIRTVPDYFGNFTLPMIQGKTAIIEIERTSVKYQITVPYASSANFLDLVPPLPG